MLSVGWELHELDEHGKVCDDVRDRNGEITNGGEGSGSRVSINVGLIEN